MTVAGDGVRDLDARNDGLDAARQALAAGDEAVAALLAKAGTNAQKWAYEFLLRFDIFGIEDKHSLMTGWFANAIEAGRMQGFGEGIAAPRRPGE
jgi:hypothetical protein